MLWSLTRQKIAVIVIDALGIDRLRDRREVAVVNRGLELRHGIRVDRTDVLDDVGRVLATVDGVEEPAVELAVDAACRIDVTRVAGVSRIGDGVIQRDPEVEVRVTAAQFADRLTVCEQLMVRRQQALGDARVTGCVLTARVGEERRAPRFVQGRPDVHPIAESVMHGAGVVEEPVHDVTVRPAAVLLQRLRHVPVIQGQPREDVGAEQLIDQAAVEVDADLVDGPTVRAHP